MQGRTDAPRQGLTAAQVDALIHAESLSIEAGLELVSASGGFLMDVSDRLETLTVARNNFATIHGTCRLRVVGSLDWGGARVKPFVVLSAGGVEARFDMGVYVLDTPVRVLGVTPESYDVEGYDLLAVLNVPAAETYTVAAGSNVVTEVQSILAAHGAGASHLVVASSAVTASAKVWPLDPKTSWLNIVNDLLLSIGHRGLWMDWTGRYRSEPYQAPVDRSAEWSYDADLSSSIVGERRTVTADFFAAPNHWVFVRNDPGAGVADPSVAGVFVESNQSDGPTSIDARGRTIPRVEFVDAVDDSALAARARQSIDQDKRLDTSIEVPVGPNPLHWHADVVAYSDSALGPAIKASVHEWSWTVPEDMQVRLRKVA